MEMGWVGIAMVKESCIFNLLENLEINRKWIEVGSSEVKIYKKQWEKREFWVWE